MRAAIFHFRDLRIGIVGVRPVVVRGSLLARPVQARQVFTRRGLDARRLREPRQKLRIGFRGIASHDAAHGRVGLERGRIDRDGLALEQSRLDQPLLDPREDRAMGLQIDRASRARDRRVIGGRLVQRETQERADRQRVARAPGDPPFRIDPFEVADQQQPEIAPRLETRSAHDRRVELAAQPFDESVEAVAVE